MKSIFTHQDTGFPCEWYHQKPGEPRRFYTRKAVRDAERIAAKRADTVTDEHIGHGRPGMTVLKACPDCGMMWAPQFGAKRCSKCRAKHASQASANARRGKAVAR